MQEYDLYIDPKKPSVGLYVRKGAGLPDLADPSEWHASLLADLLGGSLKLNPCLERRDP